MDGIGAALQSLRENVIAADGFIDEGRTQNPVGNRAQRAANGRRMRQY
jgi:hypothetical protein